MPTFAQTLENRRLFSVTSVTLATDLSTINADAKALKASFASLTKAAAADLRILTADLKGSAKSNVTLLKKLKADEVKALTKLKGDVNRLTKATVLAKTSAAAGNAVIKKPTSSSLIKKLSSDITALGKAATAPLLTLGIDSESTGSLANDVTAIATANSSNTKVQSDAGTTSNDFGVDLTSQYVAAQTFANAIITLKTDLSTLS